MSESDGHFVWDGDLDNWVRIAGFKNEYETDNEQDRLDSELEETGELQLLAGKAISARLIYQKDISHAEWRHALHKSEMTIGFKSLIEDQDANESEDSPVMRFVKGMLDLGRPYSIARYARWERLDYASALTATLPYGIRALVNQLLASEGITRTREVETSIRTALEPYVPGHMTAYHRTGILQAALHQIANDAPNHPGGARLNRNRMRAMLEPVRIFV